MGLVKPPHQKYSSPNEMKPINPFGLVFFARIVSKIIVEKNPELLFSLRIYLAQTSARISPLPQTKNSGYVPADLKVLLFPLTILSNSHIVSVTSTLCFAFPLACTLDRCCGSCAVII